jgi:hypothetical protein
MASSVKRRTLGELSNQAAPIKKKEKPPSNKDQAVMVIASPLTSKAILNTIRAKKEFSDVMTPTRITESSERSPGGAPNWVITNTARKRRLDLDRDFEVERNFPDGDKKTCRTLFFTERLKKEKADQKVLKISQKQVSEPLVTQSFGPYIITRHDLEKVPPRKTVRKQKDVMGGTADMAVQNLFDEKLPTKFHWSHILAFVLLAGKINTQVMENLFAGTDKSNWSKKLYEMSLHDILSENKDVISIQLSGTANLLGDSLLGINEELNYVIHSEDGRSISGVLHFNTLSLQTESSMASKIWSQMTTALIEIDQQSISFKK